MLENKKSLALLLILLTLVGCNQVELGTAQLTTQEKLEDFNYLYEVLEENYPYFEVRKREAGYDWLAHKDEFEKMVNHTESDLAFYQVLKKIVEKVGNDHTKVLPPNLDSKSYYTYFDVKKLYIKMGQKEKYKDELAPWVKVLDNEQSQETYSYLAEVINKNQEENNANKQEKSKSEVQFEIIEKDKIAYVKIPSFRHGKRKDDYDKLIKFWEKVKDYPNLIIDIRGNVGGSDYYWEKNIVQPLITESIEFESYSVYKGGDYSLPFINARKDELYTTDKLPAEKDYPPEVKDNFKYFTKSTNLIEAKNSVKYSGEIYLLTDGSNYSSAEKFCLFAKDTNWAKLVGTRTGGDGVGFDPILVALPNSGLVVQFPSGMGLNPSGRANEEYHTVPDIKTEEPLDKVIEIIND